MYTVDDYGRLRIVAPKDKVLKGYLTDDRNFTEHCLVNQYGHVLVRGWGGWSNIQDLNYYRLVVFPRAVERGNECGNSSWNWADWYERNWLCDSWAWIHMKAEGVKN